MTLEEMENEFLTKNFNKTAQFEFCGSIYEDYVNYAYLNANIGLILDKNMIKYKDSYEDTDLMCYNVLNKKNFEFYMNKMVNILYDLDTDILVANKVIYDIVNVFNKICMLLDSGNRLSLDFSLLHICDAIDNNARLRELMTTVHIDDDMSMVEIDMLRKRLTNEIKDIEIEGITDLIQSGYGIKEPQLINIILMRGLRLRIQDINEISPHVAKTKWLDGIYEYDDLFIETNVNRKSVIITKEKMREVGYKTKLYNIATQDSVISSVDCGTKKLLDIKIKNEYDLKRFRRKYYLNEKNELEEITENHKHLIGKDIKIRSLYTCNESINSGGSGICATCFGSNAIWNISTSKYKKDPGIDAVKSTYSTRGQKTLSFRHLTNPTMIYPEFKFYDLTTGEETQVKIEDFFKIRRSTLIPIKDIKIFIKNEYLLGKNEIAHVDTEFGNYNNNRVRSLIIKYEDKEYLLLNNSPFIVFGDKFEALRPPKIEGEEDITDCEIRYVVLNDSAISDYIKLTELDTSNEDMSIEDLANNMLDILDNESFLKIELISYRKIRCRENPRRRPDFNKDEEYIIYSIQKIVNVLPSATLQMSTNTVPAVIENPFFHDPRNVMASTYDSLFFDNKEDLVW